MIELTVVMNDDPDTTWGFKPDEIRDRIADRIAADFKHLDVRVEVVA